MRCEALLPFRGVSSATTRASINIALDPFLNFRILALGWHSARSWRRAGSRRSFRLSLLSLQGSRMILHNKACDTLWSHACATVRVDGELLEIVRLAPNFSSSLQYGSRLRVRWLTRSIDVGWLALMPSALPIDLQQILSEGSSWHVAEVTR